MQATVDKITITVNESTAVDFILIDAHGVSYKVLSSQKVGDLFAITIEPYRSLLPWYVRLWRWIKNLFRRKK